MKQIKIFVTVLLAAFLLSSCNNNSNSNSSKDPANVNLKSSGSGDDTYLELTTNTSSKEMTMNMLQKIYLSHSGKGRVEMYRINDGKPSLITIGISDASNPMQTTLIDDSAKTYSINKIDTAGLRNNMLTQHTKYSVSKIGNETIQGLSCVHGQIIKTMDFPGAESFMNGVDTMDMWLTKDIPMPEAMQKQFAKGMGIAYSDDVANQLIQMGCTGFPVKFQSQGKRARVLMQLTKIANDNFPASMFEVPSGYKEEKGF